MGMLIKNEFYKLKREWFMAFLLLLSLLPILTGGAGAVFNNSTKSLADLLAPLSALALQSFYLLLLVCWWQYSMELVG